MPTASGATLARWMSGSGSRALPAITRAVLTGALVAFIVLGCLPCTPGGRAEAQEATTTRTTTPQAATAGTESRETEAGFFTPQFILQLIATWGLSTFLVLFYVFSMQPREARERTRIAELYAGRIEELHGRLQEANNLYGQLYGSLRDKGFPLTLEQTRALGLLGLDHNMFRLCHDLSELTKEPSSDDLDMRLSTSVMAVINGTRDRWRVFAVPLPGYADLGDFFHENVTAEIEEGLKGALGALRGQGSPEEKRSRMWSIIRAGMERAREKFNNEIDKVGSKAGSAPSRSPS